MGGEVVRQEGRRENFFTFANSLRLVSVFDLGILRKDIKHGPDIQVLEQVKIIFIQQNAFVQTFMWKAYCF